MLWFLLKMLQDTQFVTAVDLAIKEFECVVFMSLADLKDLSLSSNCNRFNNLNILRHLHLLICIF